ncbi:isochorismatase family protein [uncultured Draconibacterium sp.]|uniref:cysteine hydrolase family protein n=1 Tax=uncultured Draconibacterium sp. TaxID=1573823 RepID=UPI003217137F
MSDTPVLFWNVDTQFDFVEPAGKLYVPGAEKLKTTWNALTKLAAKKNYKVINTADFHYSNSAELSDAPDFISTFPEHCMANTRGAGYVIETDPDDPVTFDWDKVYLTLDEVKTKRNIVIRKDAFDVFAGNPHTESIVEILAPKVVVVYGVTTNVCVNDAVLGLAKRIEKVYVVEDAIKELPNIPLPFENWKKLGVEMIKFEDLDLML